MKRLLGFLCLALVGSLSHAADFDVDGLPDDWEITYGFSTNGLPTTNLTSSALVGWWQMDDASQTNVVDRSANSLTGTLNNFSVFPFVSGLYSNALSFTTNSYVSFVATNSVLALSNSFSISVWFWGTNDLDETTLIEWTDANTNTWELSVATNGVSQFRFADAAANVRTIAKTNGWNVHDGDWHHIAGVYQRSNSNATLYVDGIAEASGMVTNWGAGAGSLFGLGIISIPPPNAPFKLDEVRLYNVALTSNDIWQLPNTHYDPDNDNLTNLEEYQQSKNPLVGNTPTAPSSFSANSTNSCQIYMNWSDNANNESGFKIERSTSLEGPFSEITTVGPSVTSYIDTTVESGWFRAYRVRAYNGAGDSSYSGVSGSSTAAPTAVPNTPTNLVATASPQGEIALAWQDLACNETGFKVERSTNGVDFSQIATTAVNVVGYTNSSLAASTLYYYRVRSCNGVGNSGYTLTASAMTRALPSFASGLVAYWPANETTGTIALDWSGSGHHATLINGASWTNGVLGSALRFDGSNDYGEVPDSSLLRLNGTNFTAAGWVYPTKHNGEIGLLDKTAFGSAGGWAVRIKNGKLRFWYAASQDKDSFGTLSANQWTFFTVTYDAPAQTLRMYLNGYLDSSHSVSSISNNTWTFRLGRHLQGGDYLNGRLDEVSVWQRRLSDQEVETLFLRNGDPVSFRGNVSGTVSYSGSVTVGVWVTANTTSNLWGTTNSTVLAAPGNYSLRVLPTPGNYWISAFRDFNGNQQKDAFDPSATYGSNPLALTGDVTGINLTLTATLPDTLYVGNLTAQGGSANPTVTNPTPRFSAVHHHPNGTAAIGYTLQVATDTTFTDLLWNSSTNGTVSRPWTRLRGNSDFNRLNSAATDPAGHIYGGGYTYGSMDGQTNATYSGNDLLVVKYAPDGAWQWTRQWGSTSYDIGTDVCIAPDGCLFVTGYAEGGIDGQPHRGGKDFMLSKFSPNGTRLWTRMWGTNAVDEYAWWVEADATTNLYIAGGSNGSVDGQTNAGQSDLLVTKFSSDGTKLWTKMWGTTAWDEAGAIAIRGTNLYVAGYAGASLDSQTHVGGDDLVLSKLDDAGNRAWTVQWGSASNEWPSGIAIDAYNQIYVAGVTEGSFHSQTNPGGMSFFLSKFTADGSNLWTRLWGSSGEDSTGGRIALDPEGKIYIGGYTTGGWDGQTNAGNKDIVLTCYRPDGTREWTRIWGSSGDDRGFSAAHGPGGHLYVPGRAYGSIDGQSFAGGGDLFLSKVTTQPSMTAFGTNVADNARSPDITYAGTSLTVGATNHWRISLYDTATNASPWSAAGNWFIYDPTADNDFDNDGIPDDEDPDDDNDGLPDEWEELYGLDPKDATGDNGADGDPDSDGVTNLIEYLQGRNPIKGAIADPGVVNLEVWTPLE